MILMRGKDITRAMKIESVLGTEIAQTTASAIWVHWYFYANENEWLFQGPNTHRYVNSWSGGGLSAKPGS